MACFYPGQNVPPKPHFEFIVYKWFLIIFVSVVVLYPFEHLNVLNKNIMKVVFPCKKKTKSIDGSQ